MSNPRVSLSYVRLLIYVVTFMGFLFLPTTIYVKAESVYSIRPATVKQYTVPHHSRYGVGYLNMDYNFKQKDPVNIKQSSAHNGGIFKIEASDAVDGIKYSQPDIAYSLFNSNSDIKVPLPTLLKHKLLQSAQNHSPANFQEQSFPNLHSSEKNTFKPMQDIRFLDSPVDERTSLSAAGVGSDYKLNKKKSENALQTHSYNGEATNVYIQTENNFTDASENLVSVSSDAVLSYEDPYMEFNDSTLKNSSLKQSTDIMSDVPSQNFSDVSTPTIISILKAIQPNYTTPSSTLLNTHIYKDYSNYTNSSDIIMSTSIFPSINSDENVTHSLPSMDSENKLSSGTVAGIVIAVLVCVTLLSSAVIYLLYRKFNGKCTSVVESKFNSDNCGYLDDSLRSSIYLNNHIELPKESSEEMTSLDNDSFLNSLETMTIQNYWADNSKNTKV